MTGEFTGVSRETVERLEAYANLIRKWSPRINLVASSTLGDLWERHIRDSAQLDEIAPSEAATWADLGSGGGLPGIVIAILRPQTQVTLIESDQRKATFLRTCLRTLGLQGTVIACRIEEATPQHADVVSARALAPLPKLLGYVERHLGQNGCALLPKGQNAEQELADARETWSFDITRYPSVTDPAAQILKIERISRA